MDRAVSERVKKQPNGFNSISEIPAKYRLYEPLYEDVTTNAFIPAQYRDRIFAITSIESHVTLVYLLIYKNDEDRNEINSLVRRIVTEYKEDVRRFPNPIKVGEIRGSELKRTIEKELKSNAKKNKVERKKDDDATRKVALAEKVLADAMNMGASDLHIESDDTRAKIRLRVHKELFDYMPLTFEEAKDMANIFYGTFVRANEDNQEQGSGDGVYLHSNLLDGEFSRAIGEIDMKARMVNIGQNVQDDFNMILRLIDKKKSVSAQPFPKMGYSAYACEKLKVLQTASRGMILVGGVTGSGKSTFMQNSIMHERDRCGNSRKIYSVEQPIEQKMPGVTQINADNSHKSEKDKGKGATIDFSFDNINRMLMRGDPDSIAYGEIRDESTAAAAVKGVESGHLVYGTMHIQEAIAAFSRFETFGVHPDKICRKSFIKMIIFQHLVPKICPHCSKPYKIGDDIPDAYGEFFAIKTMKGGAREFELERIRKIQSELKPGESLLRVLQRKRLITASEVVKMQNYLREMNQEGNDPLFKERLNNLMMASSLPSDQMNVRFRGDGCEHCFNGTVGVVPAVEILTPDEKFLDLVMSGKLARAETHWRSKLNGRSATQDTYDKIMSGAVDPRMVEEELDELGS